MSIQFSRPDPIVLAAANPSGAVSTKLIGGVWLRALVLDISMTVNFAGASTIFTDALARSLAIRVHLDGTGAKYDIASGDLWKNYTFLVDEAADDYTEFVAGGAGNATATWRTVIPFSDPRIPNPDDAIYDVERAGAPRVEVQFNGVGSITATAGAHTLTSCTVNVVQVNRARPTGLRASQITADRRFRSYASADDTALLPAGGVDKPIDLDVGQRMRRIMLVTRERTSATRAYSDSLVSMVQWSLNGTFAGKASWSELGAITRQERRVVVPTGVRMFDFDKSSALLPKQLLNLAGTSKARINFDMAAALANGLELRMFEEQIILPPRT